jgi:hypothetical protein
MAYTRAAAVVSRRRSTWLWNVGLAPPFVGLLWVPFYNRRDPVLAGFPFFYWYQFAWIAVSAALTALVYFATRDR